ncbi:MAG: C25 family cysteine peptidase, partial [Candidatus Eisenbacteria bacterium]|nr:C25 family cysteine peptidase [Candidatus Eisenbacteria bacterium]
MRLLPLLGLLGVLVVSGSASALPEIRSEAGSDPGSLPAIEVLSSDDSGVRLRFDVPVLEVVDVVEGSERFQAVTIPGGARIGEVGQPAIPVFTRLVMVPEDAEVQVEARAETVEEMPGVLLAPLQPDEGGSFTIDRAAYERPGYGDEDLAAAGELARMRGLRLVPVTFRPIAYDAARRALRVTERMSVEVRFVGGKPGSLESGLPGSAIPRSFDRIYRDVVMNYPAPGGGENLVVENGTWLLISSSDAGVLTRLQPLIEWRKRKGMPVVSVTTQQTGTTAEQIKAYIQNAYNTWPNPPEFIVLAGDANGSYSVPTFYENVSGYYGEGDHPYTQLEGSDVLADAHVGRLSFSSYTELETIVAKIVGYESAPSLADPNWFQRACLVGDPYPSGPSCVQIQQWAKVRLRQLGYTQIDTVFSGDFVPQMATALNRGDTVFSYRGYYNMSGWGNNNTYALTNGWKLPFVVTITCDTGSFANGTSRSEGFLRAGTPTTPRGGIGAIGTATIGTHTRFNNCIHYGILYGLLYNEDYELGAALTRGKLELWLNYQTVDPNRVIIWSHWNNLMGDPALECFTGYPYEMAVQHEASIPLGANSFVVQVSDHGVPEAGAQVCLYKGEETFAVGLTDAEGRAELPIHAASAGNMLLTVTKHDQYPYLATVPVQGQQRYVAYVASQIDDDAVGESQGDGDGILNPGESIELRVQLRNYGILSAPGVNATLTCADPYVSIDDDAETFGDIPGGGSAWSADDFGLTVSAACPNAHVVRLGLDISSGTDVWHSLIDVPASAPD